DCICRVQQDLTGHRQCEFPVRSCLSFSSQPRDSGPHDLSKEEAIAALERFEEMGLVHTVSNVAQGVGYVCNCCGCCCGILRGITQFGIENSVAQANYFVVHDPDICVGCGVCSGRCQVQAISSEGGRTSVDRTRCIGCGLCVSGCPQHALILQLKPESTRVTPPQDFADWEHQRLKNRGLIE
ncbi:MAG: 4Fe-4S binding protein, partial [Coprothermobacterota bacterium]|nr:4Fe-4S binding protein [Coprothermobacterota bacterium]